LSGSVGVAGISPGSGAPFAGASDVIDLYYEVLAATTTCWCCVRPRHIDGAQGRFQRQMSAFVAANRRAAG
jgi:hypothetical protein